MSVSEDFHKEDALETVGGPLGHLTDEPLDPRYFSAAMWERFHEDIARSDHAAGASYEAQRTRAEQLTFDLSRDPSQGLSQNLSQAGGSK